MKKITAILLIILLNFGLASAHNSHYREQPLEQWIIGDISIQGSLCFFRNDSAFIETENHSLSAFPIEKFSEADKEVLKKQILAIHKYNHISNNSGDILKSLKSHQTLINILFAFLILTFIGIGLHIKSYGSNRKPSLHYFVAGALIMALLSFTDPHIIQDAFLPFASSVHTFWDNDYFYVESKGIPETHSMMTGISDHGWQQQVPIPQCYIGGNAWSIPLNPVMATNPIPVDQIHFTRGAIAIAVNGVPIFNPYTNTGVDALTDGQLDNYGGHCGRADDYHYHTAPLHLYNHTNSNLPIAYAFDGFPVYGVFEPDGSAMGSLDLNHGHSYNGSYHYHGTNNSPYMIARFAGLVSEDSTHQLIPQAQAHPVRTENWGPLNGALITSCTENGTNNGYRLSYTLNGVAGYGIDYSWNGSRYDFNYISPAGNTSKSYNGFVQCDLPLSVKEVSENPSLCTNPNPFSDMLKIDKNLSHEKCEFYDYKGTLIYSGTNIDKNHFAYLPSGAYYLYFPKLNKSCKTIKR